MFIRGASYRVTQDLPCLLPESLDTHFIFVPSQKKISYWNSDNINIRSQVLICDIWNTLFIEESEERAEQTFLSTECFIVCLSVCMSVHLSVCLGDLLEQLACCGPDTPGWLSTYGRSQNLVAL